MLRHYEDLIPLPHHARLSDYRGWCRVCEKHFYGYCLDYQDITVWKYCPLCRRKFLNAQKEG